MSAWFVNTWITEIRSARHALGVTQMELAEIVGCRQATISDLERGSYNPSFSLICKIVEVLDLNLLRAVPPPRITSLAAGMRKELIHTPPNKSLAFRILSRFTSQWRSLTEVSDRFDAVATRPLSTSDPHFDALLAGYVEHLCVVDQVPVPDWVYHEVYYLETFWWRTELPRLRAVEMAETPGALSNRKVFTSERSLESV